MRVSNSQFGGRTRLSAAFGSTVAAIGEALSKLLFTAPLSMGDSEERVIEERLVGFGGL